MFVSSVQTSWGNIADELECRQSRVPMLPEHYCVMAPVARGRVVQDYVPVVSGAQHTVPSQCSREPARCIHPHCVPERPRALPLVRDSRDMTQVAENACACTSLPTSCQPFARCAQALSVSVSVCDRCTMLTGRL